MVTQKRPTDPKEEGVVVGVAWYRREQWPRLLEISEDREKLEESYDEWLESAVKGLGTFASQGLKAIRVDVDTEELLAWCARRNLPVDGKARAEFTTEKVQKFFQPLKKD